MAGLWLGQPIEYESDTCTVINNMVHACVYMYMYTYMYIHYMYNNMSQLLTDDIIHVSIIFHNNKYIFHNIIMQCTPFTA